jgi:hypothetical protein
MTKPAGPLEAQLRGMLTRIKGMERELRQKDRVIGNLISTQDAMARCLKTISDTQAVMQKTQDATIAANNATTATVNAMGGALAWLMAQHAEEGNEASVH